MIPNRRVIFVFGSNLAGIHGAGAAKEACDNWVAQWGVGEGLTGNAYAIPTKDGNLRTLPLDVIRSAYERFHAFAKSYPDMQFLLTPFGTGLAGYSIADIRSIMELEPLRNVWEGGDWKL